MFKKNKIFLYHLKQDILFLFLLMIFILAIHFVLSMLDKEYYSNAIHTDNLSSIILIFNSSTLLSYQKYEQYITFGFCRRKFYHEQVILCGIRAALLSLFRSIGQFIHYNEYVQTLIKDTTETADMYHPIAFSELFFTNLCLFFLIGLIFLANSSHTITIAANKITKSPQLQLRIQLKKEKNKFFFTCLTVIVKTISFILIIAGLIGLIFYHQMQLQNSLSTRMTALFIVIVLCIVIYLDGRWRFRPKYV